MDQNEQSLAHRLKLSDREAFIEIYRNFYRPVLYFVSKYIPDTEVTRDIVSDVFTELWVKRAVIDPTIGYKSIVLTMARNKCLNHLRRQKVFWKYINKYKENTDSQLALISLQDVSMDLLLNAEFDIRLKRVIDELPDKYKEVFIMSRKMYYTNSQIAEKLSISEKTVEYRMSCVLKILRKAFRDVIH